MIMLVDEESLPSRERGLKHCRRAEALQGNKVAPFAGAWIETCPGPQACLQGLSLPSRERGLKRGLPLYLRNPFPSLPSRERGLKQ